MPKLDPASATLHKGASYPAPFDEPCRGRDARKLGAALGLTQFGANVITLAPGAWASQRHWHAKEDEFAYVLEGTLTLIEDEGETVLRAGDAAGWPAGVENGHHLVNNSDAPARFLVVGTRDNEDHGDYPDIDMKFRAGRYTSRDGIFLHKDGTAY